MWAAQGARGFKAKGISPQHLKALVERAHMHGLPVTGHLESGFRNSTNARDAILMGIDRVEHILGGDALDSTKQAYPSWNTVDIKSKEFKDIVALFVSHRVAFDATITAPVYFATLQEGFDYWIDERKFFTPAIQEWVKSRPPRQAEPGVRLAVLGDASHDEGVLRRGRDHHARHGQPEPGRVPRRVLVAPRAARAGAGGHSAGRGAPHRHDQRRARAQRRRQARARSSQASSRTCSSFEAIRCATSATRATCVW